jgi:regulatory factor X
MQRFEPDSAIIPNENQPTFIAGGQQPIVSNTITTAPESESRIFSAPQDPQFHSQAPTYKHKMKFSPTPIMRGSDTEDIVLPNIYDFAPAKWDTDIKDALQTTYYSHVISLIDSVRYCKEKNFFRLITAFQGTMTVPVVKLFFHEEVAQWVRACDFLMYQKIIRFLAPLTLQVIPPKVMKFLCSMSKLLNDHIVKTFGGIPKHTLDAKLESATVFCQLIERLVRANQTAHAAGAVLIDDNNRLRMWSEFIHTTNPKSMMSAFIPDCGYDEDVYKLLTFDIRNLLLPLNTNPMLENDTHYQDAAAYQNSQPQPLSFELDRMGDFVESLKARYPTVPSKDLLHLIQSVTSYILRDIVMENGQSYNCWLVVKCFVDELALWLVHAGGFLDHSPLPPNTRLGAVPNGVGKVANGVNGNSYGPDSTGPRQGSNSPLEHHMTQDGSATQGAQSQHVSPLVSQGAMTASTFATSQSYGGKLDHLSMSTGSSASGVSSGSTAATAPVNQGSATPQEIDIDDSGIGLSLADEGMDPMSKFSGSSSYLPPTQARASTSVQNDLESLTSQQVQGVNPC